MQQASGIPHALFRAEGFLQDSGAARREAVNVCLAVIASAAKQSILSYCGKMDCFASLAMTVSVARRMS